MHYCPQVTFKGEAIEYKPQTAKSNFSLHLI